MPRPSTLPASAPNTNEPDVQALGEKANILRSQGNYAAAALIWQKLLAYAEKTLGHNDPSVGISQNRLAGLLMAQGKYKNAEGLYRKSLQIYEKALAQHHPFVEATDVARTLNELAISLSSQGKNSDTESLARRSLEIYEKTHGPDHPNVATALNNLGKFLQDQGQYRTAEPIYRRSLEIWEKTLGPNHPDVALSLNNLAGLKKLQGQYSAAEMLYRRSLGIREKSLGPNHPDVAISLNNLAALMQSQRKYSGAEAFYRRSLAILEKSPGSYQPDIAIVIGNLANVLQNEGQYSAAETLYRRALNITEKSLGTGNPEVTNLLSNLGTLLDDKGRYSAAETLYRQTLRIREIKLGPNHPDVALSLDNLSSLLHTQGKYRQAIAAMNKSLNIQLIWLTKELPLLPASRRIEQLSVLGKAWQIPFGLIDRYPPAGHLALNTRLKRQGLLQEVEQIQTDVLNKPSLDRSITERLQFLTQQLASVSLPAQQRTSVREQRDKLQADLYRQYPDLQIHPVTIGEVAKALPANGALIEFQRFQPFDGRKPANQRWGEPRYLALILKTDGSIQAVPLGSADPIDAAVHKGLAATAQNQVDAKEIWGQLSDLVLRPLLPHLNGSREWFLSPDGELNRVPFAALPSPQQSDIPLAEAVLLRQLTTGRDLLRLQQPAAKGKGSVVFANPDYGRSAENARSTATSKDVSIARQRSSDLDVKTWRPLTATVMEGQQVATILSAPLLTGTDASATRLQQQQGPRILHIATHGFFVADVVSKPQDPLRLIQDQAPQLNALRQEDPQLRSGLVLAGANQPDADRNDDGYLTAAEAVALNLMGTELVVLSACSTGQGDIRTGEGVYGLQRSLAVAGARSTLLSLWKVDDAATLEFMTRFYQRLKAGVGRADALAATQKEFRAGIPGKPEWKQPYYWAAWQLVGDWRPINGL